MSQPKEVCLLDLFHPVLDVIIMQLCEKPLHYSLLLEFYQLRKWLSKVKYIPAFKEVRGYEVLG